MTSQTRREFLEFLGITGATLASQAILLACASRPHRTAQLGPFQPLPPSGADDLLLSPGLAYQIVAKWGDVINSKGEEFGTHNDFLAFFPLTDDAKNEGLLWVNHEYLDPLFVSGFEQGQTKTRQQVLKEMMCVGGSILHIQWNGQRWELVRSSQYNRRLTAQTPIPFAKGISILGSRTALGTVANCAGGITPWNTVLTCEENYENFYGEVEFIEGKRKLQLKDDELGWVRYFPQPPEHYGWVVEVDPFTGNAKKHTSMGRFSHECATCVVAKDGRTVVYSGDDHADECLYKFISSKPGQLESGELFVANIEKGEWVSLAWDTNSLIRENFRTPLDALIRTREAAHLAGGSCLDRPEDVEIEPRSQNIFVSLTCNPKRGNLYGAILKLIPENGDHLSTRFQASTFKSGGKETGFACPDNLAFDAKGNLWFTSDISGNKLHTPPYQSFKNNGLFFVAMSGPTAGSIVQVASAPVSAEFTGPRFSPDGQTLFLSVQHPGEHSKNLGELTSHWPAGGTSIPRSAVVAIRGPALDQLIVGAN